MKTCICDRMVRLGDMAPRLFKCEVHGRRAFIICENIIKEMMGKYYWTWEQAWDKAYELFEYRREEAKTYGNIYSCEDHFEYDLYEKFIKHDYFEKPVRVLAEGKWDKFEPINWVGFGIIAFLLGLAIAFVLITI